jgi:hypothetical protein
LVDNWTSATGDELAGGERLKFEAEGASEVSVILVADEGPWLLVGQGGDHPISYAPGRTLNDAGQKSRSGKLLH